MIARLFTACAGFLLAGAAHAQFNLGVLHSFTGNPDGQHPSAPLICTTDGILFGTTRMGGNHNAGVVFRLHPPGVDGAITHHFEASAANPFGLAYPCGLIQGLDGGLYGTSSFGGKEGAGIVFRLNADGSGFTQLHSFARGEGRQPAAALVQGRDGLLLGTTQFGGHAGLGTVFRLGTNGAGFTQLYSFGALPDDPRSPQAPLIQGADGAFYGTSPAGGAIARGGASGYGTVFRIDPATPGVVVLHSFARDGRDGAHPLGGLVQGPDGTLYGTTQEGGLESESEGGFGTIFKLKPDGSEYAVIHRFDPVNGGGRHPGAGLLPGNDGVLYGTTEFGGHYGFGVVFRVQPDGTAYTILHHFGSAPDDGRHPRAPLTRSADGGLIGATPFGGQYNLGAIFRLGPPPARISLSRAPGHHRLQVTVTSAPQLDYRIETSTNHLHWTFMTNLHNFEGVMRFEDPGGLTAPQRFYRAVWTP
jgi:uncharacterized repeat protein (TIGR03803 family)